MPDGFPAADAERGRGLLLVEALVGSLSFESEPEEGTVAHLTEELEFDGAVI